MWARASVVFPGDATDETGQEGLGLASLNNFNGLWGKGCLYLSGTWPCRGWSRESAQSVRK